MPKLGEARLILTKLAWDLGKTQWRLTNLIKSILLGRWGKATPKNSLFWAGRLLHRFLSPDASLISAEKMLQQSPTCFSRILARPRGARSNHHKSPWSEVWFCDRYLGEALPCDFEPSPSAPPSRHPSLIMLLLLHISYLYYDSSCSSYLLCPSHCIYIYTHLLPFFLWFLLLFFFCAFSSSFFFLFSFFVLIGVVSLFTCYDLRFLLLSF